MPHEYQIGQRVRLMRRTPYLRRPIDGPFVIVARLHGDGPFGVYRVRQEAGTGECVAAEEDLEALPDRVEARRILSG